MAIKCFSGTKFIAIANADGATIGHSQGFDQHRRPMCAPREFADDIAPLAQHSERLPCESVSKGQYA